MPIEHLRLLKEYLEDNLMKGFIVHSEGPNTPSVLFARKPGGWRFCVDYRKLNEIMKKDQYPLTLIDETLARPTEACVYTKLDIRQAFYHIRLKEPVENLTTFRTRCEFFSSASAVDQHHFSVTLIWSCLTISTISAQHTLTIPDILRRRPIGITRLSLYGVS